MMECQIIKIGEIIKGEPYIIMFDEEDSDNIYYISILKDYAKYYLPNYVLMKTNGIIRGSGENIYKFNIPNQDKHIKGVPDGLPVIGKPFSINNGFWQTSIVENIINDNLILTKNSVYAIHNVSVVREKKLKDLGL